MSESVLSEPFLPHLPAGTLFPLEAQPVICSSSARVLDARGREVARLDADPGEMKSADPSLAVLVRAVEQVERWNDAQTAPPEALFCPTCGRDPTGSATPEIRKRSREYLLLRLSPLLFLSLLLWGARDFFWFMVLFGLLFGYRPLQRLVRLWQRPPHPILGRLHACSGCGSWMEPEAYVRGGEISLLRPPPGENRESGEGFLGGSNTARAVRAIPLALRLDEPVLSWVKGRVGGYDGIVVATPSRVVSLHQSLDGNLVSRSLCYLEMRSLSFQTGPRDGHRGRIEIERLQGRAFRVKEASSVHRGGIAAFAALVQLRLEEARREVEGARSG